MCPPANTHIYLFASSLTPPPHPPPSLLTLESATRPSPSSWISLLTFCSFSSWGMLAGRRRAAEKLRFSLTVSVPITTSSCRRETSLSHSQHPDSSTCCHMTFDLGSGLFSAGWNCSYCCSLPAPTRKLSLGPARVGVRRPDSVSVSPTCTTYPDRHLKFGG